MATKYVRCESHCKYPAYSSDEVDALFYKKDNLAVLTGNTSEGLTLEYPEGFNKDNCVVVSYMFRMNSWWFTPEDVIDFENQKVTKKISVQLSSNINIFTDYVGEGEEYGYKIVLMKVGE